MGHPNIRINLDGVEGTESIAAMLKRNLEHATLNGFALSDLPPSAAIVSASSMSPCTASGNSSKSLRAAFSHDMGLVFFM
ncbi:MAG: hypothetical protein PHR16_17905 [Methylovulum sp.]|nr:hypothetical protein [Methylovulum sp.]